MFRLVALVLFLLAFAFPSSQALEKQPASDYHARRVALGDELHGGVAILFAAEEPVLDFDPYRQDSDFYYLTGWNEPGAALLIIGPTNEPERPGQPAHVRDYKEILFLPTRNLRMETYTGAKMDAATPGVTAATGVDNVEPMTNLAADLNKLIADDRRVAFNMWTQPGVKAAESLLGYTAATLGASAPAAHDVTTLTMPLREVKDAGEIDLLKKAATASIAAQREMMQVREARRDRADDRRKNDRGLVRAGLRAAFLCAHRRHRHQLDDAPLLRELRYHRRWRRSGCRCGLRVLDVRL